MNVLDFIFGIRMLSERPVLTLIGGLAMAVVIAGGAAYFELTHEVWRPTLPIEDGDRVVGIMYRVSDDINPVSLQEFVSLREELESIEEIGAYREVDRNMIVEDGRSGPIEVARTTPSAFRITGAHPLLGRTFDAEDMRAGAPQVAVLGYDVWQVRFGGDPNVVGRTIRLGSVTTTVAGVMPEGFAFPENHNLWTPLRPDTVDYERGESPVVTIFGRLAPGYTRTEAGREITAFGSRHAGDFPKPVSRFTDEPMRLSIMPFTVAIFEEPMPPEGFLVYPFFALLLGIVCAAFGALLFARNSAGQGELTAGGARKASPAQVIMQAFAGVLVLVLVAAALGLAAVRLGQGWGIDMILQVTGEPRPFFFWWDSGLTTGTLLYAAALAVVGAMSVGIVPAWKMTRRVHTPDE